MQKKKIFRNHAKTFFLDENNQLYKKIKKNKNFQYEPKIKQITQNKITYVLLKIPQVLDILDFIGKLHSEDDHRGINSLRHYLLERGYYVEGSTFIIKYIINNCTTCNINCRNNVKREPVKQIITFYPKE